MGGWNPITPTIQPGILKDQAVQAAAGRYIDGNWVRFVNGYPEKIGGWTVYTGSAYLGTARGAWSWNDLTSRTQAAFATERHLYWLDGGQNPVNITPFVDPSGVALTNALATTITSNVVTVNEAAHSWIPGQFVYFASPATVGGVTLSGYYEIQTTPDANHYTILAATPATSTVAAGGGSITIFHELAPGSVNPAGGYGWGVSTWGALTWNTPRASSPVTFEPYYWTLNNFGKLLLAAPYGGKLYSFDPTVTIVPAVDATGGNGPGAMRSFFVTPERYVIALGCSPDTGTVLDNMRIRWCTQDDLTTWAPSPSNTAGGRRLTEGKRIVGGASTGSQVSLIWTDTALYLCQYTGSDFVFDTRVVGKECGLAGPSAFAVAGGTAYWASVNGFYLYNGGVQPIPNQEDVKRWIMGQLRHSYETKTLCFHVEEFNEIWWLFVTGSNSEPDTYVMVNTQSYAWSTGTLSRTAALSVSANGVQTPVLFSTDGYAYQHETGLDANGSIINSWIQAAPMSLSRDEDIEIEGFNTDFQRQVGDLTLELVGYYSSGGQVAESATVVVSATPDPVGAEMVDLRFESRLIGFTLRSNSLGGDYRLGRYAFDTRRAAGRR